MLKKARRLEKRGNQRPVKPIYLRVNISTSHCESLISNERRQRGVLRLCVTL